MESKAASQIVACDGREEEKWMFIEPEQEKEMSSNCIQRQNAKSMPGRLSMLGIDAKCNHPLLENNGEYESLLCVGNIISLCHIIASSPLGGDTFLYNSIHFGYVTQP